jgi:hypothetical protein
VKRAKKGKNKRGAKIKSPKAKTTTKKHNWLAVQAWKKGKGAQKTKTVHGSAVKRKKQNAKGAQKQTAKGGQVKKLTLKAL